LATKAAEVSIMPFSLHKYAVVAVQAATLVAFIIQQSVVISIFTHLYVVDAASFTLSVTQ